MLHKCNRFFSDLNYSSAESPHLFYFLDSSDACEGVKGAHWNPGRGWLSTACQVQRRLQSGDITSTPKAVNKAVRHIVRISKAANERCDLCRNVKRMEMSQCCNCVSHVLLFTKINCEANLGVMQMVVVKTMLSKWHNSGVIWGIRGAWNGSEFVPRATRHLHANETCLGFYRSLCGT